MTALARSRKMEILAAAQREFAAAGFAGARIERIAASASVNKQLLFHYFDSKEGLFAAALAQLLAQLESAPRAADSPVAQLKLALRDLLEALRAAPGLAAFLTDAATHDGYPAPAAQLLRAWRERLLARFAAIIQDGQRRGYFRDDIDPAMVATVAAAAAVGVVPLEAEPRGAGGASPGYDELLHRVLADYCAWR